MNGYWPIKVTTVITVSTPCALNFWLPDALALILAIAQHLGKPYRSLCINMCSYLTIFSQKLIGKSSASDSGQGSSSREIDGPWPIFGSDSYTDNKVNILISVLTMNVHSFFFDQKRTIHICYCDENTTIYRFYSSFCK